MTIHQDLAGGGFHQGDQDTHQGGFSSSIGAQESEHTIADIQVHLIQSFESAGIGLTQIFYLNIQSSAFMPERLFVGILTIWTPFGLKEYSLNNEIKPFCTTMIIESVIPL